MENLFVPYEIAKQLKEKGFDAETLAHYINNTELLIIRNNYMHENHIKAPLYQQVVDWFREKHNTSIVQIPTVKMFCFGCFVPTNPHRPIGNKKFVEANYYEALNKAIEEAIKLI